MLREMAAIIDANGRADILPGGLHERNSKNDKRTNREKENTTIMGAA
jgi:hypothetical protein